jgi:hypothetical protein
VEGSRRHDGPTFLLGVPDLSQQRDTPLEAIHSAWDGYEAYLAAHRDRIPPSAYAFATAPWHYDFRDRRCPHDAWLESCAIREPAGRERRERRWVEIELRLLGAFHDGHLILSYTGVTGYRVELADSFRPLPPQPDWHGDCLTDEVTLTDSGAVRHVIRWSSGSRWEIQCADIGWRWEPLPGAPDPLSEPMDTQGDGDGRET